MQTTEREFLLNRMDRFKPVRRCNKCFGPMRRSGRFPFEGTKVYTPDDLFKDMEYMRTWHKVEYWECLACVLLTAIFPLESQINT